MSGKKGKLGLVILLAVMAVMCASVLRSQSLPELLGALSRLKPQFLVLGLGLMLCFVGCEALCTRLILGRLGHRVPYRRCLGYSFVGFYVSSITPSSTGGQPAQIYYMSRDGVPAAHGSLDMLLIAVCYQVTALAYAGISFVLLPGVRQGLGTGLGLLLLYGGSVMLLLTLGMLCMMFLPGVAERGIGSLIRLGARLGLLRRREAAEEKAARQLAAYRQGAEYIRQDLSLVPVLLGITFVQLTALYAVPYAVYLGFGLRGAGLFELAGTQAIVAVAVGLLPLPGAVGAAEGGAARAFSLFFGPGLVAPAVLAARGVSFYSVLLLSFLVSLGVHARTRRRDRAGAAAERRTSPFCLPERAG